MMRPWKSGRLFLLCAGLGALSASAQFGVIFSYEDYAALLKQHVDKNGHLNYDGAAKDREKLDNFIRDSAGLYVEMYEGWPDDDKLAYWINTYNANAMKIVLGQYPVKSVKEIARPAWDHREFMVKGDMMTLGGIVEQPLRTAFTDPRVHFALNPGARGGPPLRREPYLGASLNKQLDDQVRRCLASPDWFRLDRKARRVHLSPVFKWHGADFARKVGEAPEIRWGSPAERAVMTFLLPYLAETDKQALRTAKHAIKYLEYDWSLNKQ